MSDGFEDRLQELTAALVRCPTPTGETEEGWRQLEEFLRRAGVPSDRLGPEGGAPVLVAGRPPVAGRPTFLLANHLDTVPVVGAPSHPAGSADGGHLYGRGALDMKGGLAMSLLLLQEFSSDPRFNVGLVVTTDEEAESGGAWALLDRLPSPPDLVLVPEPTWEEVGLSAPGRAVWQVSVHGRGGHGEGLRPPRTAPRGATAPANPLLLLSRGLTRLPRGYTPLRLWTEGEGELTIPHAAHARVDRALPPGADRERDRRALERSVRSVVKPSSRVSVEVLASPRKTPWLEGYRTSPRDPWVSAFLNGLRRELRRPARPITLPAVGDYNVFGSRFPTLVFGPGGGDAHGDDEWLDLASLRRCAQVYRRFLLTIPEPRPPLPVRPGRAAA